MGKSNRPKMHIAAEVYIEGQIDPIRAGHIASQGGIAPGTERARVERIVLYRASPTSTWVRPENERPVLILDPMPTKTTILRRNIGRPDFQYLIEGTFRCWVAPESRISLVLEFSLSGRVDKFEIGALELHELDSLDRDRLIALNEDERRVLKCPTKDLRKGDRPAAFLDQILGSLSGSSSDEVIVYASFVGLPERRGMDGRGGQHVPCDDREVVLRLGFELNVPRDFLQRLSPQFLPETLTHPNIATISKSNWPSEVIFRQGPRGWPSVDDQQESYGRSGDRLPSENYLLDCHGPPNRVVAALWNCWVDDHLRHVETARDGQPRSFIPHLDCEKQPTPKTDIGWHLVWRGQPGSKQDLELEGGFLGLRPASERRLILGLPQLRNHRGEIPRVLIRAWGDARPNPCGNLEPAEIEARRRPWRHLERTVYRPGLVLEAPFETTLYEPKERVEQLLERDQKLLRMGSLDLELDSGDRSLVSFTDPYRGIRLLLDSSARPACEACHTDSWTDHHPIVGTEIELYLAIADVGAGGQDGDVGTSPLDCRSRTTPGKDEKPSDWREKEELVECGFSRQRPLVIPLATTPRKDPKLQLVLEVRETRDRIRGSSLDMSLSKRNSSGGSPTQGDPCGTEEQLDRVLVLDPDPFFAAVVAHEPLGSLGDASTGTEIATWRNRGLGARAWHLHLPSRQGFCLTLPPQSVGETMERYRTLGDDEPADFRLGPPTRLSIRTTYFEQNFPEAPWNLRRLLTRPGGELPGAELEAAHLELLYGLSCHMELDDRMVRLAEIATLVGAVPGPLERYPRSSPHAEWLRTRGDEEEEAYYRYRKYWSELWAQLAARLALFEVWDPASLELLRQREGVSCWIRTPDSFYPNHDLKPVRPERLKDLPTADLAHPIDRLTPPPNPQVRHPKDKCPPGTEELCGGVTWGFESRNVFEAIIRPEKAGSGSTWPRATTAELSDLRLSALGAWGHQMAAFENGLTTIYGNVAMGRTFAYRIERIGRIGVFWHRAKHVIVYERSVVPGRQFMSDQSRLGGRPVLRKVREFVELLENERSYPDSGGGTLRQLGFIRRMSFATQADEAVRFHVKSAWGSDLDWDRVGGNNETIEESGWKVPIWIQGAEPADVFPRPRIRVTVASVIDGETRDVERYIDNPENLYFFTRTTDGAGDPEAANTNAWPSVPGVDFVDRGRPAVQADAAFQAGRLKQTQPSDRLVPSGHGVTTFLLEPSPHGADLTVHRPGDPMSSLLRSFTMSRSRKGPSGTPEPFIDPKKAVGDAFGTVLDQLPNLGELGQEQKDAVIAALEKVKSEAGKVKDSIKNARNQAGQAKETFDKWATADLVEEVRKAGEKALEGELNRWIGKSGGSQLEKALKPLVLELLKKKEGDAAAQMIRQYARNEVENLVADLSTKIVLLTPSPLTLSSQVLAIARRAMADLDVIIAEGKKLEEEAEASADQVLKAPDRLERQIRAWLARLDGLLDGAVEAAQSGRRVAIDTEGKLGRVPLPGIGRKVLSPIRDDLLKRIRQAREAADTLRELATRTKVQMNAKGEQALKELGVLRKRLEKQVLEPLKQASTGLGIFESAVKNLEVEVGKIEKAVETLEGEKQKQVEKLGVQLKEAGNAIVDAVIDGTIGIGEVDKAIGDWLSPAEDWIDDIQKVVRDQAKSIEDEMKAKFGPKVAEVENALGKIEQRAEELKTRIENFGDDARRQLERERDILLAELEQEYGEELHTLRRLKGKVDAVAEPGLRLIRAFGEPPEVKGLQFDRPETAFIFGELDDRVGITPVIGRVAQAANVARAMGDVLEPLGVDLPVKELGEKLIPEKLKNFQLSDILPNIAGLRLDKLFSGIKMPDTGDDLKVRHGIDPKTRRAFFHAELL